MYLPCVVFDKFDVAILKILFFDHLMAEKFQKVAAILFFCSFLVIKWPKTKFKKNRYIKFVECHTGKIHSKFQVPNMFAVQCSTVQMNVPFVKFHYRDLKVLPIPTVFTGKSRFSKKTTQARNNIFIQIFAFFTSQQALEK